jgi:hypothetical protein
VPARANIGETLDQLRARYGSAKDMGGQMLFEVRIKDGQIVPARGAPETENLFAVSVYFDGTRSAMEVFTRNSSDPAKANMTEADIQAILDAMGNGIPWAPFQTANGRRTWLWGDRKDQPPTLLARFSPAKGGGADNASVLVIMANDNVGN